MCIDASAGKYHEIADSVGFLLGVPTKHLCEPVVSRLTQNKHASILRGLCELRSLLMVNYDDFALKMKTTHTGLYSLVEQQNSEVVHFLRTQGIQLWSAKIKYVSSLIATLNSCISDRVNNCKDVFPAWLNWEYVRAVFLMPDGQSREGIEAAVQRYKAKIWYYPFQMYLNGKLHEKRRNILGNDCAACCMIYESSGDTFKDISKVTDANMSVKKNLFDFIESSDGVVIAVDCENSDPYKMCATLMSFESKHASKINKIILIDDVNASSAWQVLESYTQIPVERLLIERVVRGKSLVDITLSSVVCKEHYANGVNSVMLFSSDSDYWGLASTLPAVRFFVMIEERACSEAYRESLSKKGIQYCCIDDFYTGDSDKIKYAAVKAGIEESLRSVNVLEFLDSAIANARASLSEAEREHFITKYLLTGRISIDSDGSLVLKYPATK